MLFRSLAEIALQGLANGHVAIQRVVLPPVTPPIQRDVALAAPAGVQIGDLVALAQEQVTLAQTVELFDLFSGAGMAEGERSVGLRFTFQPAAAAALDSSVDAQLEAFAASAATRFGTRVRGTDSR